MYRPLPNQRHSIGRVLTLVLTACLRPSPILFSPEPPARDYTPHWKKHRRRKLKPSHRRK